MDNLDKRLLSELRTNARIPISSLAATLGVARTTIQARIQRLEQNGTIAGYSLRLGDAFAAGQIRATVLLQVDPKAGANLFSRLKSISAVQEAHTASGRFDVILQVVAQTTAELDAVLDHIGEMTGVLSSESLIQLRTKIKRSA
ncbi:AsnC family transcriptional regulator [Amylibacter kogurei]|uniref:AsnC family transcriptional regulator n=1 Tax=Paramylibacter kogurei TaxID=1889778 RepID=A0A2G5K455_9RHOB|nr:Lrp/AsnC family transcriptional regulator [Amylibacter kogurei]PIB23504.1 AsnC family transcriptional regulator [Amylibacter kogurei]